MLFRSKAAAHQFYARPEEADMVMGYYRVIHKALVADFGQDFGSEQVLPDVHGYGGDNFSTAVIVGGVFDSLAAQKANGWTDDDRKLVEQRLIAEYCEADSPHRGDVWLYVPPKAEPPWPTYENLHHSSVAEQAEMNGLLNEALIYEQRRDKPRETVMAQLKDRIERKEAEKQLVAQ